MADTSSAPASLPRRLGAMLYDALLVLAVWMVTLSVLVVLRNDSVVGPGVQSLLFIEMFTFFAYCWVTKGQTLGMLAWHLYLVGDVAELSEVGVGPGQVRGGITLKQALLRFVTVPLSLLPLGLGYLWIFFDGERRAWPDIVSHTRVLHVSA